MGRNTVLIVIGLSLIWLILLEGFTILNLALGIVISAVSVYICHVLIPLPKIAGNINLFRFALYPFYLVGQVYVSALNAVKLVFTGADVDIIEVQTRITNPFLRTILANSITLTPGSVSLELKDDLITQLWLKGKKESHQDAEKAAELIKRKLEKKLIVCESGDK